MMNHQTIYLSATPSDYELKKSKGIIIEQVIRPTGLLGALLLKYDLEKIKLMMY